VQSDGEQAAATPDLDKPSGSFLAGAVKVRVHDIDYVDDALATHDPRPCDARGWRLEAERLLLLDKGRFAVHGYETEKLAVIDS
jgi:hypothetical protein